MIDRVQKKSSKLTNPPWPSPGISPPHDFCDDFYHEWAMCYATGRLHSVLANYDKIYDGTVVCVVIS